MGKTLLICSTLPPLAGGSAIIVGNLARQFSKDEMVIVGEKPYNKPPVAWRAEWPEIHYIANQWPEGRRGVRWRSRLQVPLVLARTLRLARENRCTAVLAVYPFAEFLLVGYLTARRTGAAFFPYFHNTYLENRAGLDLTFAKYLQPRVFARARHVFVMSEGIVELYRERYPHLSCSALVHTFNEPLPAFSPPPKPGSPLHLLISGNINDSCLDAALRTCEAIAKTEDARLTILSGTNHSFLARMGILREGVRHDTVSRDELLERLCEADIVVLPHGFTGALAAEEYQTIFPTKTIEYLICGRPILAHTPPDCFLTRFLRERDCALIVDRPSIEDLQEAIARLRSDVALRARLVRNALKAAEMFQASRVAEHLRATLGGA